MAAAAPIIIGMGGGQPPAQSTQASIIKWVAVGVVALICAGVGYYIYIRYFKKPTISISSTDASAIQRNKEYSNELQTKEEVTQGKIEETGDHIQQAEKIITADLIVTPNDQAEICKNLEAAELANKLAAKENEEDILKGKMVLYNSVLITMS